MGIISKLASQTAIYGLSSIFGRFINYLLVPLYTYHFSAAEYGVVSEFYAYAGFLSVFLLLGFETGYFRFRDKDCKGPDTSYSTALIFVLLLNLLFLAGIVAVNPQLSAALHYPQHPEYALWFTVILTLDAIAAIPFARLRAENRAFRFAGIKLAEILITVLLSLLFIVVCPKLSVPQPQSWQEQAAAWFYQPAVGVGYIFIANLIASSIKFLLLIPQLMGIVWGFDRHLFTRMFSYSWPMAVIGFAGIINEMLDRALLKHLLPGDPQTNLAQLGIYSACYKLSILMSLFIQAFRYAAEPFFFAYADKSDAKRVYALVLRYFVIFCVFIFLLVTLYLDYFKYFLGENFRSGLPVVPILLFANLFLGIYVNLSVWYKLTDRTSMGAWVSIAGAVLTVALNIWWIPQWGYVGSAWATLVCYAFMALLSYCLGQIYYPVAYDIRRIVGYIAWGVTLYGLHLQAQAAGSAPVLVNASGLMLAYLLSVWLFEGRRKLKN
ncbi:oligosaccharide flippase family protein [Methylosoma difficile]